MYQPIYRARVERAHGPPHGEDAEKGAAARRRAREGQGACKGPPEPRRTQGRGQATARRKRHSPQRTPASGRRARARAPFMRRMCVESGRCPLRRALECALTPSSRPRPALLRRGGGCNAAAQAAPRIMQCTAAGTRVLGLRCHVGALVWCSGALSRALTHLALRYAPNFPPHGFPRHRRLAPSSSLLSHCFPGFLCRLWVLEVAGGAYGHGGAADEAVAASVEAAVAVGAAAAGGVAEERFHPEPGAGQAQHFRVHHCARVHD